VTTHPHLDPAPQSAGARWLRWRTVNISRSERAGRIVLGLVGMAAGVVLLTSAASALVIVLEVLLVGAGVDLLITGATGHCPLYQQLGHAPKSLRGPR
jgi:fucose permease